MKYILFFLLLIFLSGCSFAPTTDQDYWTEDNVKNRVKKKIYKKQLPVILKKSDDIRKMSLEEYKIYIDAYTRNSAYPDISK